MMDYKVRTFMAVVDLGTLARASEKLGITQPAVSQHIRNLEEEYGIPLFYRSGRRLVLNDAGRLFRQKALTAQGLFDEFLTEASSMKNGRKSYRIGATLTIGEFILPAYLGVFKQENPSLELTIHIENTNRILEKLDRHEIDVALVEGPFDKDRYEHRLFLRDEMVFVCSGTGDGMTRTVITQEEIEHSRLILREKGSGTRYYWEEYCRENRIRTSAGTMMMEVGSLSAIKSLVEAGLGCTVMSIQAVRLELTMGTLRAIPFETGPLLRDLFFVFHKNAPPGIINELASMMG